MEKNKNYQTVADILVKCCRHTQKSGMAYYDDGDKFLFTPDDPVNGLITPFRSEGVAQVLSDGTFDFVRKPRLRAESELILKSPTAACRRPRTEPSSSRSKCIRTRVSTSRKPSPGRPWRGKTQ